MNENRAYPDNCARFCWKPIFAGALVAIGLTFLLNLFSVAIELTAFTTNSSGMESLALGGLVGIGLGTIASMFVSGWLAGYLGQRYCEERHLGALYGFLTWSLALMIAIFTAHHVQNYVAFYGHFLSGATKYVQINHSPNAMNVNAAIETKSLVISTYILFGLFFLSAFASTLGGHCGMRHCCKKNSSC